MYSRSKIRLRRGYAATAIGFWCTAFVTSGYFAFLNPTNPLYILLALVLGSEGFFSVPISIEKWGSDSGTRLYEAAIAILNENLDNGLYKNPDAAKAAFWQILQSYKGKLESDYNRFLFGKTGRQDSLRDLCEQMANAQRLHTRVEGQ